MLLSIKIFCLCSGLSSPISIWCIKLTIYLASYRFVSKIGECESKHLKWWFYADTHQKQNSFYWIGFEMLDDSRVYVWVCDLYEYETIHWKWLKKKNKNRERIIADRIHSYCAFQCHELGEKRSNGTATKWKEY